MNPDIEIHGHARLREGRQPVDPDGERGSPAHGDRPRLAADLVAGRAVDLLHRDPPDAAAASRGTGTVSNYDLRYPILTQHPPRRDRPRGAPLRPLQDRAGQEVDLAAGSTSSATRPWRRTDRTIALVSDGPDPTTRERRPPAVRREDEEADARPASRRTRRSATRIPPGGPTASCSSTSRTGGRDDGRAGHLALRPGDRRRPAPFTGPGYTQPPIRPTAASSRPPRRTRSGTDVVVLDARNGTELLRVTSDGRSWGAAWSPDGTQLAFLRLRRPRVDLQLATLERGRGGSTWP